MRYLILLALLLVGCNLYNEDMWQEEECPQVVYWTIQGEPQCGYSADMLNELVLNDCPTLLNWSRVECATYQERICAMGARVVQYVDPVEAFCSTKITTQDGCIAYFEGPLEVR